MKDSSIASVLTFLSLSGRLKRRKWGERASVIHGSHSCSSLYLLFRLVFGSNNLFYFIGDLGPFVTRVRGKGKSYLL